MNLNSTHSWGQALVVSTVRKYRCLTKSQLMKFLELAKCRNGEKLIYNLVKQEVLFEDAGGEIIKSSPLIQIDRKTIHSFWVYLACWDRIKDYNKSCLISYPMSIFFAIGPEAYEIMNIDSEEDMKVALRILSETVKDIKKDPYLDLPNYMICVSDPTLLKDVETTVEKVLNRIGVDEFTFVSLQSKNLYLEPDIDFFEIKKNGGSEE